MDRKKTRTLFLAIIFLALAFYSMLAFINNLDISYQWHKDVISKTEILDEEGNKVEKVYTGVFPSLDWTCVDMSVVSTFCPFLGFLLIGIGFIRILAFKREGGTVSKSFPFFEDYDRIMVILGLAGTLWGIIMIGFYRTEDVTMPKLMLCLHTSLYSTLVVILWIFLVSRPIGNIMRWWYGNMTGRDITSDADISAFFRELGASVSGASKDFKAAGIEAFEFKKQTEAAKKEFKGVADFMEEFKQKTGLDVFGAIKSTLDNLATNYQNINATLIAMKAESEANKKLIDKQQEMLDKLSQKLTDETALRLAAEKKLETLETEKTKSASLLEQIKSLLKGLT